MRRRHTFVTLLVVALVASAMTLLIACEKQVGAGGGGQPASSGPAGAGLVSGQGAAMTGIVVRGSGTAIAQPELALINMGVESDGAEAGPVIDDNVQRMTRVMEALTAQGIAAADVQTVGYQVWKQEVYDLQGQPTGEMKYHAANQIRVRVSDPTEAGAVVSAALAAGATTVQGISFAVADRTALEREARDKAIADAKERATQLAEGLGAKVGALRYVSDGVSYQAPGPYIEGGMGGGGGGVPLSAGELSVTANIEVVFEVATD